MIVVALASDHAGVELKKELGAVVAECGFEPLDLGVNDAEKADYPVIANTLASMIVQGHIERGILICGTLRNRYRHQHCRQPAPGGAGSTVSRRDNVTTRTPA